MTKEVIIIISISNIIEYINIYNKIYWNITNNNNNNATKQTVEEEEDGNKAS